MIDWASRIDDLADKLAREYSMYDRDALEIMLAAMVNCPRTDATWLVLETNWYARECDQAWFSFGEEWLPESLMRLRGRGSYKARQAEIQEWLDSPSDERLFVEPDFEHWPLFDLLVHLPFVLQRSLRLRTPSTRAADPLRCIDHYIRDRMADELNTLTRFVLEDRLGARGSEPPRFLPPENFLYHVELVQRLAPWYRDWDTLVRQFASVAVRRAYLLGRKETNEEDNRAMARLAHDSIPFWIQKALCMLLSGPQKSLNVQQRMRLEEWKRRSYHGAKCELERLHHAGIIRWDVKSQSWAIERDHRDAIARLLEGRAFQ